MSQPIDFDLEMAKLEKTVSGLSHEASVSYVKAFMMVVAERVEAQTIERCEFYEDGTLHDIKRLYPPSTEGEEKK